MDVKQGTEKNKAIAREGLSIPFLRASLFKPDVNIAGTGYEDVYSRVTCFHRFPFVFRNHSWCLDDPPSAHAPTLSPENRGKLPGEIVDGDQQCRNKFGKKFKRASRQNLRVGNISTSKL